MNLKYQAHIDGLRAISVIAVIIYHAKITILDYILLPGGFLGVDIFFVISGYLISLIIIKELNFKNGKFSFINFYKRRARRILPALFFVILITKPFIIYITIPNFLVEYSKSIISSLFFISNYYFWSLGTGYDQIQFTNFQPFLHTWSLSIEEQFYLFFPIIFFLIYFLKRKLFILFFIVLIISLFISDYLSDTHSSINFYSLLTRIWELLLGSIFAIFEFYYFNNKKKKFSSFFSALGLLLIIGSFIIYNDRMFLPSLMSLPPLIGVILIIYYRNSNTITIRLLSLKPLVYIGLISYSLYLWHYPIINILKNLNIIILLVSILILSIFTYHFIERPFRDKNFKKLNDFYKFFCNLRTLFVGFLIILFINILIIFNNGFYSSKKYPEIISYYIDKKFKKTDFHEVINENLILKKKDSIFILGDSHMLALSNAMSLDSNFFDYNIVKLISSGCYYINNFNKIQKYSLKVQDYCNTETQEIRKKIILSHENPIVIIGGRLDVYTNSERYNNGEGEQEQREWWTFASTTNLSIREGVKYSILELLNNGARVILVYPIPGVGFDVNKKIFDRFIFNNRTFEEDLKNNPITTSYENYKKFSKTSYEILDEISHQNLYKIYPDQIFCNKIIKNRCLLHNSSQTFYEDNNHLSYFGNKFLINSVLEKLKEINVK